MQLSGAYTHAHIVSRGRMIITGREYAVCFPDVDHYVTITSIVTCYFGIKDSI